MDCKTKQMSSYQRLKWEMDELYKDYQSYKTKLAEAERNLKAYRLALLNIARLKGPECLKAPEIAEDTLYDYLTEIWKETHEKE